MCETLKTHFCSHRKANNAMNKLLERKNIGKVVLEPYLNNKVEKVKKVMRENVADRRNINIVFFLVYFQQRHPSSQSRNDDGHSSSTSGPDDDDDEEENKELDGFQTNSSSAS